MLEYNGSIELISGITQKNSGTFPLVNAPDVLVPKFDKRLDVVLDELNSSLNFVENQKEVISVDTYNDLFELSEEQQGADFIYITEDTQQLYIYQDEEFKDVTNKNVDNTIYVTNLDSIIDMRNDLNVGIYDVQLTKNSPRVRIIEYSTLYVQSYRAGIRLGSKNLTLANRDGWANIENNHWQWHYYSYTSGMSAISMPSISLSAKQIVDAEAGGESLKMDKPIPPCVYLEDVAFIDFQLAMRIHASASWIQQNKDNLYFCLFRFRGNQNNRSKWTRQNDVRKEASKYYYCWENEDGYYLYTQDSPEDITSETTVYTYADDGNDTKQRVTTTDLLAEYDTVGNMFGDADEFLERNNYMQQFDVHQSAPAYPYQFPLNYIPLDSCQIVGGYEKSGWDKIESDIQKGKDYLDIQFALPYTSHYILSRFFNIEGRGYSLYGAMRDGIDDENPLWVNAIQKRGKGGIYRFKDLSEVPITTLSDKIGIALYYGNPNDFSSVRSEMIIAKLTAYAERGLYKVMVQQIK